MNALAQEWKSGGDDRKGAGHAGLLWNSLPKRTAETQSMSLFK